ncbi:MAG: helix-turn-helix transcriptional regulator [Clostridia bacterium]|nr:helix-turn-helix transcriptional regulator [Clostridia bacterium]
MNIGSNIARLRREMGLTQEQLGNLVSVSAQAVSKWENGGMPDTELISAIADALHVTIDTLFGREDVKSADMQELFQARSEANDGNKGDK